jgi:hypothetical protein
MSGISELDVQRLVVDAVQRLAQELRVALRRERRLLTVFAPASDEVDAKIDAAQQLIVEDVKSLVQELRKSKAATKRFSDALTHIEYNEPGGIAMVARAMLAASEKDQ